MNKPVPTDGDTGAIQDPKEPSQEKLDKEVEKNKEEGTAGKVAGETEYDNSKNSPGG